MKREEAERRIKALLDFHAAVGEVLQETLTGKSIEGFGVSLGAPKPGRATEWTAAKAKADMLSMPAARAFDAAGVALDFKRAGTWHREPVNPALVWHQILEQDTWFPPSMLDQMTNRAIGRLQDLRDDPPAHARRGVFIPFPTFRSLSKAGKWAATIVTGLIVTVLGAGIAHWLGWV
ncbi:MAG: hypothetical protein F2534_12830 [Actinobacteria bacterium]|uniref:Unannotated protein n=1 Tax=freshwater metagenome TaxID=449393 RepID=A0A6J6EA38_9ZZZZ|nr:hypothetical protein [Actinomycetota bacterium]